MSARTVGLVRRHHQEVFARCLFAVLRSRRAAYVVDDFDPAVPVQVPFCRRTGCNLERSGVIPERGLVHSTVAQVRAVAGDVCIVSDACLRARGRGAREIVPQVLGQHRVGVACAELLVLEDSVWRREA